jgi:hypothetical protein
MFASRECSPIASSESWYRSTISCASSPFWISSPRTSTVAVIPSAFRRATVATASSISSPAM